MPNAPVANWPDVTSAVWTGSEMIVHAVRFGSDTVTRGTFAYRSATNAWQVLARGPAPVVAETTDVAVWTGSEMVVAGLTNGAYNPATSTWRSQPVAAWTGTEMIVSGGMISGPREPALFTDGDAVTPAG